MFIDRFNIQLIHAIVNFELKAIEYSILPSWPYIKRVDRISRVATAARVDIFDPFVCIFLQKGN